MFTKEELRTRIRRALEMSLRCVDAGNFAGVSVNVEMVLPDLLRELSDEPRKTVREHARDRGTLGGADAQALEHAVTITERERDALRRIVRNFHGGVIGKKASDDWWHACGYIHGTSLLDVLKKAADETDPDERQAALEVLAAAEAALADPKKEPVRGVVSMTCSLHGRFMGSVCPTCEPIEDG